MSVHDYLFLMFPLALAIFVMEIGREIMVNAGDFNGDLKAGYKTLPVLLGRKKAMYVALIFYIAFIPIFERFFSRYSLICSKKISPNTT